MLWGLGVILAAAGCGGGESIPWQARAAEQARELAVLEGVPTRAVSREQYAAEAEAEAGMYGEYLAYLAETYGRLGFFDPALDLAPVFAGSRSDWVGATYSPSEKLITVVGEASDSVVVHEWVHALQDQHFGLDEYDSLSDNDSFLARRAVVEGDAVLAQNRFGAQQAGLDLDAIDWAATFDGWRGFSADILAESEYPVVFLDYVSFVYTYGLEFSAHNLTGVTYADPAAPPGPYDWTLQDELFTQRPPHSTRQVLELDVVGDQTEPVTDLGLDVLPEALAAEATFMEWDRLGAWYVYLLLYPLTRDVSAGVDGTAIMRSWRGDQVTFARRSDNEEVAVVWASAWADEAAATAVVAALWTLHAGVPDGDGPAGAAGDGERLWIEQRGERVVLVKNLPDGLAAPAAEAAFAPPTSSVARRWPSLAAAMQHLGPGVWCPSPQVGVWVMVPSSRPPLDPAGR